MLDKIILFFCGCCWWCRRCCCIVSSPIFPAPCVFILKLNRSRPEVRTLARAPQIEDAEERKKFLQHTFTKLEELDEFVKFVEEGIEYLGNDFGFALRTNMPQDHFDKMKAVYAEAAAIRRLYLQ